MLNLVHVFTSFLTLNVEWLINQDSYKLEILHAGSRNNSLLNAGGFILLAIAKAPHWILTIKWFCWHKIWMNNSFCKDKIMFTHADPLSFSWWLYLVIHENPRNSGAHCGCHDVSAPILTFWRHLQDQPIFWAVVISKSPYSDLRKSQWVMRSIVEQSTSEHSGVERSKAPCSIMECRGSLSAFDAIE